MSAIDRAPGERGRVLILEDSLDFRLVLAEFLEGEGYEVATCDSYASIRAAARVDPRSIVLADFWGSSQVDLDPTERDEIRELGRLVPTILLTGRTWAADTSAEELNVVCLLPKPSALEEILGQVERCLSQIT